MFLAEVANKVCGDLLGLAETTEHEEGSSSKGKTLCKAQTALRQRLMPAKAKKSKAQPPKQYAVKRHKRPNFVAFAINEGKKQIMQAQSNQVKDAELLVTELTTKLNDGVISVEEAIEELNAAKA